MLAQWLDYRLDIIGFKSWEKQEIFLSYKSCRLVLGPTQFPIQWVPSIFPWSKVAAHDVNHSLLLVPRLRMSGAILPLPPYAFMACTGTTAPLFHLLIFMKMLNETYCNFTHMTAIYCCTTGLSFDETFLFSHLECILFRISPYYLNMTNI